MSSQVLFTSKDLQQPNQQMPDTFLCPWQMYKGAEITQGSEGSLSYELLSQYTHHTSLLC